MKKTQLKIIEEKFYVKNNALAIQYIKNPTEEMCLEAVKQEGSIIKYIKKSDQSFDIIEAFFSHFGDKNWKDRKNIMNC